MNYVKYVVAALSAACVVFGLVVGLQSLGGHGIVTLVLAAVPLALVGLSLALGRPFGRGMAAVSLVAFLIVGMKTSGATELENVMMLAFVGLVASLVIVVRPERAAPPALA